MEIRALLEFAVKNKASDLHLSAGCPPIVRIDGELEKLNQPAFDDAKIRALVAPLLDDRQKNRFKETSELDFSAKLDAKTRFRINLFEQVNGMAAVFRVIPVEIQSFEDLGLPDILKTLSMKDRGLILVTGPTGCGKSTTLAAMVDHINEQSHSHIITIEDPIEFLHSSKRSLVNQREVGAHTASFYSALRVALREDPDVILVGEMRDLETVQLALTAAETGHLVLATLHTSGAGKTINRVIDIFPEGSKAQVRTMLSESLAGVLCQRLLPRKEGKGRVAALEVLMATTAVRNLIREDKVYQLDTVIQAGAQQGMMSFDASLLDLMQKGEISVEEALKVAADPGKIRAVPQFA